ncbi:MAG: LEA type 2 family protein [Gammaproteobacteria bacterium]|nr:LEA type 2 family protein [Gammaproteobacteria bacterium]
MRTTWIAVLLLSVLMLQGCASSRLYVLGTMKKPELEFLDYKVQDVGLQRAHVDLLFKAHNPNHYQIDTFFVSYDFYLEGKLLAEGRHIPVALIPEGTSEITVPVVVSYSNLMNSLDKVLEKLNKQDRKLQAKVKYRIFGEYEVWSWFGKSYKRDYFYESEADIPIDVPEVTLKDVGQELKNRLKQWF